MPDIKKSSRHSKITGDFAEGLVLYWLSKHGFETARVDHTGIDLIAKNSVTNELMGISVKSRSRSPGTEKEYIGIENKNFAKVDTACAAFGCVPYFAILADTKDGIEVFILSKKTFLKISPMRQTISMWKMGDQNIKDYKKNKDIISFEFSHKTNNWWTKKP